MSFKETLAIVAVTAVGTWLIFSSTSDKNETDSSSKPNQTSQQTQGGDSSSSHHGASQPVSSTVFEGLVGKAAPDFTLESSDGKKITLSELKGKNVVLFFNEGLMCYPACWNQIAAFGTDERFKGSKSVALNIVNDPKDEWASAVVKMPQLGSSTVLFDTDRKVSQDYGVLALPSSMHRGQFPGHSYVILDKEGIVRFAKDDPQMAVRNDLLAQELAKL